MYSINDLIIVKGRQMGRSMLFTEKYMDLYYNSYILYLKEQRNKVIIDILNK